MKEKEKWKDIPGFEGLYQVSTLGNVRSLFRYRKILKQQMQPNGYKSVQLYKNKKAKFSLVHRLVAKTFISNPLNKPAVNHLNEIRSDNRVTNLEWVTNKENQNYGHQKEKMSRSQGKTLLQFDKCNNFVASYYSGGDAQRKTGISRYKISLVANGKRKTAGGYIWKFGGDWDCINSEITK